MAWGGWHDVYVSDGATSGVAADDSSPTLE
jgi:hypothetical protein